MRSMRSMRSRQSMRTRPVRTASTRRGGVAGALLAAILCAACGSGTPVDGSGGTPSGTGSDPGLAHDPSLASDLGAASDPGTASDDGHSAPLLVTCRGSGDPACTNGALCAVDRSVPGSIGLCVHLCEASSSLAPGEGSPTGCDRGTSCVRLEGKDGPGGICLAACHTSTDCPRVEGLEAICHALYTPKHGSPSGDPSPSTATWCDYSAKGQAGAAPASSG